MRLCAKTVHFTSLILSRILLLLIPVPTSHISYRGQSLILVTLNYDTRVTIFYAIFMPDDNLYYAYYFRYLPKAWDRIILV